VEASVNQLALSKETVLSVLLKCLSTVSQFDEEPLFKTK